MQTIALWAAIIFVVWLVLFLAFRWVMLWYFRLNDIGNTLYQIREELHAMNARQRVSTGGYVNGPAPSMRTPQSVP
jgi:hypothetical protein